MTIEEMQAKWTNIKFTEIRPSVYFAQYRHPGNGITFTEINNVSDELEEQNNRITDENHLMKLWSNLFFGIIRGQVFVYVAIWTDGKLGDGTSTGYKFVFEREKALHEKVIIELNRLNLEAQKTLSKKYFFCSGHGKAELKEDFSFFYFAGNYCKEWAEMYPEFKVRADFENYN